MLHIILHLTQTLDIPPSICPLLTWWLPEKGFMFGSGKVSLEASLEREVYYHGEDIPLTISINNQSKKAVKNIRVNEKYVTYYTR